MKLAQQSVIFLDKIDGMQMLANIEKAGRTCYKSEDRNSDPKNFVKMLICLGHESVLEHEKISVKITTERGITHEIVRHRIGSYSQESTRYCNYASDRFNSELTFIVSEEILNSKQEMMIYILLQNIEQQYNYLIKSGIKPENARDILPNCLKSDIVVTYNLREWRHFLKTRIAKQAHPKIRELSKMILEMFRKEIPVVFDDIGDE